MNAIDGVEEARGRPVGHPAGLWEWLSRLDLERLLPLIVFLGIFLMATRSPFDTDTWWHLRSGQYIVETRSVPFADPFSHTVVGRPWVDPYWLAQIFMYAVSAILGMPGLTLALAAIVTLTYWLVWRTCDGNPYLTAFAVFLSALASSVVWVARPQIVSFLLAALVLRILSLYKHKGVDRLVWLPVIIAVWVNLHGGYIIGFILIGGFLVGECLNNVIGVGSFPVVSWPRIGRLALFGAVCLPAVLLNPSTYKMYHYPFFTVGMGALQAYIEEWASPNFHLLLFQPAICLLLAVVAVLALSRARVDFTDLGLVAAFTYMALLASRNVALFALVAAPVVSRYGTSALDALLEAFRDRTPYGPWLDRLLARKLPAGRLLVTLNWLLVALLALAGAGRVAIVSSDSETQRVLIERGAPLGAISYLKANSSPERLFNEYNWGGFLIWSLYPQYRVYVDGRTDLYEEAFIREYMAVLNADASWQEMLDRRKVGTVVVDPRTPLARALSQQNGWQREYADEEAVVWARLPEAER